MLVTLSGIERLVKLVQYANAPVPDAGDAVANRGVAQVAAGFECIVPDGGDAVGNRHAGQSSALQERDPPDGGNWQVTPPDIDRAGDGHRTAGADVSRDGDRAVVGSVSELGLHRGGQRQQQQERQQHLETRFHGTH